MHADKRQAGIQAVQTLSRLNRAHPGRDTTYVVDFVNDPDDILAAFKPYHTTAELASVSDPEQIYTLRAKLDGQALYDSFEVDRVAEVATRGRSQSELDSALVPVADRLLRRYAAAQIRLRNAGEATEAAKAAKEELDALTLFKRDIATFVRLYGFLSQIFNYGNTDIEKRAIFFRLLHRLLDFGRDSETVDLSSLALTHYTLRNLGTRRLPLDAAQGDYKLGPSCPGGGEVRDKERAALEEIIARVNQLFVGELTEGDKLLYVNNAIKGKLLECETLIEQAVNNTREQFGNSPDLDARILDAVMDALSAFTSLSRQALESERIRAEIKAILLGPGKLYESLRQRGGA